MAAVLARTAGSQDPGEQELHDSAVWRVAREIAETCHARPVREVSITGDDIRLGQLLKLADAVDQGSDAKELLADGGVTVNGQVETRRGRRLVRGDEVSTPTHDIRVV